MLTQLLKSTLAKVSKDSSHNLHQSLGRAKGMLSKPGHRAVNAAFSCMALMLVFIVFANKKRQGWRNRDHPLTSLPCCMTRLAAGISAVTWELAKVEFRQVRAGAGLHPSVCDGWLAVGAMCTKGILGDAPCRAAKAKDYESQNASCFVENPTKRLRAAARQDLLEVDSASHHLLPATSLHPTWVLLWRANISGCQS